MLIPDTLFSYILNNRELYYFPKIKMSAVLRKRTWKNKSKEEMLEFSRMRSEIQKRVHKNLPCSAKKRFFAGTSRAMKEYWKNVDEEKKQEHIKKMSSAMKKAWDNADDNFGPKKANIENQKKCMGGCIVEENLPRINDYCGVITNKQMEELNG